MTYWKATVEKPDGNGGWEPVGVFGTDASPVKSAGRHLHGDTALAAAQLLLSHVWPIDLGEPGRYEKPDRWKRDQDAKTGIADHRITVEVGDRNWDLDYGKPQPKPLAITVAELRLIEVRQMVAGSVEVTAKAAALTAQAKAARQDAQHAKWRIQSAVEEATRAGVEPAELAKAKRVPRPRKSG
jgi:hypothetical protein